MKTKLMICLCVMISASSVAQQNENMVWYSDGSLKFEDKDFKYPLLFTNTNDEYSAHPKTSMLWINSDIYLGQEANVEYGIVVKKAGDSDDAVANIKLIKKRTSVNNNYDGNKIYDYKYDYDHLLLYACQAKSLTPHFTNNDYPSYVYSYTTWLGTEMFTPTTAFKRLLNRPKHKKFFGFIRYTSTPEEEPIFRKRSIYPSPILNNEYPAIPVFISKGVDKMLAYLASTADKKGYDWLVPQTRVGTYKELVIPDKIPSPSSQGERDFNKLVDLRTRDAYPCKSSPYQCYDAPFTNLFYIKAELLNAHLKYVNIPGQLQKNITPYQLFRNYQYITDLQGEIIVTSETQLSRENTSDIFQFKHQTLPKNLVHSSTEATVTLDLNSFTGTPTYYIISKDEPEMDSLYYQDLGDFGDSNGQRYKLYRFQTAVGYDKPIPIKTGPEGPFLAGHNLKLNHLDPDITISVYPPNSETPSQIQNYAFGNNFSDTPLNLTAGDSVVFTTKHADLIYEGIPEIWLARSAGESKYYCTPDIQPNEYKPFLGFDSQVHGVAVRKHPTPNNKKTPKITYDPETDKYSWYWIAQRRMDLAIKDNTEVNSENVTFLKYKTAENLKAKGGTFSIGGEQRVSKQRNNQREGYNMQLLYAWKNERENPPVFKDYGGSEFILGTDPDEVVYLGCNGAKIPSQYTKLPDALLKLDVEEWKLLPEGEHADPINEMVTAYQRNRTYVEGGDYDAVPYYRGYEISDKGLYKQVEIPGVSADLKPCNGKPCVRFFQDGNGADDNNKAPGKFTFSFVDGRHVSVPVTVKSPQANDYGFYGSIVGDRWPSEWQKNVPYTFRGLAGLSDEVLNTLVMEYTHENELGILTKDTRYFRDGGTLSNDGKWTEHFDLKGWGYNEITVYVQRNPGGTMVPIAGMELMEVMLRFLAAPGSKFADFSPAPFRGIDLQEGRGEGNYWYLRDVNHDPSDDPVFGRPMDNIAKSYTISKDDTITFTVEDSDPHTFFHYDVEWYLSERFMAKRLPVEELSNRVHWYYSQVDDDGLGTYLGTDTKLEYRFKTPGKYHITAVYGADFDPGNYQHRSNTRVSHEINVMSTNYDASANANKGMLSIYPMSPDQIRWVQQSHPNVTSAWRVAEVDNIFSQWTHIDGPRAAPPNDKPNRYGLENDYNAHFEWKYRPKDGTDDKIYKKLIIADPNLEWFPHNWIRHYSGNRLPDDMKIDSVGIQIKSAPDDIDAALRGAFPNTTPEPWQWRLPWVSLTNWQGYRTRANIKVIFNMKKLFDNAEGAFAGVGVQHMTAEEYADRVSNPIPELTDHRKSNYDFYLDLLSGRKVLYNPRDVSPGLLAVYQVNDVDSRESQQVVIVNSIPRDETTFLKGADMSMVKNLEDEGIGWKWVDETSVISDPYQILAAAGANVVRFRLWVNPVKMDGTPYEYSTLESVTQEILRAKSEGLKTIFLCLHYSDTWADPAQQIIPAAWTLSGNSSQRLQQLEQYIHDYTIHVLSHLQENQALPHIVQTGNEIEGNLFLSAPYEELTLEQVADEVGLQPSQMADKYQINWDRNTRLINAGLSAVRSFSPDILTMIHHHNPVEILDWLRIAFNKYERYAGQTRIGTGIVDKDKVDLIGLSFYLGAHHKRVPISYVKQVTQSIGSMYGKKVLIAETGFPFTYGYSDETKNIYGESNRGAWPANVSALDQVDWLYTLKEALLTESYSLGFLYWEPFWVGSNTAQTKDFKGSNWENMTFFEFKEGIPADLNLINIYGGINVFSDQGFSNARKKSCWSAKEVPYHTSFESDLIGGWFYQLTSGTVDWFRRSGRIPFDSPQPVYAKDGSHYMLVDFSVNKPKEYGVLRSPCFNLKNVTSPHLYFNYIQHTSIPTLELRVYNTSTKQWSIIWQNGDDTGGIWEQADVDLSAYAGTWLQLSFKTSVGNRGAIAIDNIYLKERVSSNTRRVDLPSEENAESMASDEQDFELIPNPNDGNFIIKFRKEFRGKLQVLDITGTVIHSAEVNELTREVDVRLSGFLTEGIYIVNVTDDTSGKVSSKNMIMR